MTYNHLCTFGHIAALVGFAKRGFKSALSFYAIQISGTASLRI